MKKCIALIAVCALAAACLAADFSASLSIKTGDTSLDLSLRDFNTRASTPAGAVGVRADLRQNFSLSDREITFLSRKGYTLAEIYYLVMLAKHTGKHINDVAALHGQGVGWGVLAKRLGVRPSDLNKLRVQQKKTEKVIIREKTREQIRIHAPAGGGGRGMGRGKGR